MLRGLNAENQGFPLGGGTLDLMKAEMPKLGMARVSANLADKPWPVLPDAQLVPLIEEVSAAGMTPFTIVRDAETVRRCPFTWVDFTNEPDISRYGWDPPSAAKFLTNLMAIVRACDDMGYPLFVGGTSNFNKRGFKFDEQIPWRDLPPTVGCSKHRYADQDQPSPAKPNKKERLFLGPDHRDREVAHLRGIVGNRPLGIGEVGYESSHVTEAQQAEFMKWELDFWERHGFVFACAYQINDSGAAHGEKYGFRDPSGRWKLVAKAWAA